MYSLKMKGSCRHLGKQQRPAPLLSRSFARGNVSVVMGAGGNIAVLPGRDGKLLVDAGFAGARPKITAALASISSDPIKHLINTHWHFDHTDGKRLLSLYRLFKQAAASTA